MKKCGRSPMQLIKFFKENPDPLGIKEKGLGKYTKEEVSKHCEAPSIWTIYNGKVYDITLFLDFHSGGIDVLKPIFGKDCTHLYNKMHSYLNIDNFIGKLQIGTLEK